MTRLADDPAFWASLSRQFDQVEEMLERLCDGVSVEETVSSVEGRAEGVRFDPGEETSGG